VTTIETREGPEPQKPLLPGLALAALFVFATYIGWRAFWFITDDAMIAFRYVSNSVAGRGLVWNPAPFAPVEGYTSFLWCILLEWTWRLTGIEPPQSSNWLALGFGYATLWVGFLIFRRSMRHVTNARHWFTALALAGLLTLTNRTFLAWLSSGLETSLFNFCLTWWFYEALTPPRAQDRTWLLRFASSAAATALARPDGMLFVAATIAQVAVRLRTRSLPRLSWMEIARGAPLAFVALHLLWRKSFYGEWLPNTFYAKYIGFAAGRGADYVSSFIIEYGLWLPLLMYLFVLLPRLRDPARRLGVEARWIPWSAVAIHLAFYTLAMGGDHFEYRVYSYVPLLALLATTRMAFVDLRRDTRRLATPVTWLVVYAIVSLPIPWAHWLETRRVTEYTGPLFKPIANRFPVGLRTAIAHWDDLQEELIQQSACVRHQEHKIYFDHRSSFFPSRDIGRTIPWDSRPVHVTGSVGIVGWVLPNVAIIDYLGLNDRVIARTPPTHPNQLAHAHRPPEGYVDCFAPNVFSENKLLAVEARAVPLTDERIVECERRDWSDVPPNLKLELRRSRERRKRLYEIALDDQAASADSGTSVEAQKRKYVITDADTLGLSRAIFAGGCFWCEETAFEDVPGVQAVISGYVGGQEVDPTYEDVSAGRTGHTEAVLVTFDPGVVSYQALLEIFWVNHDPTTNDRQFCDQGRQYRPGVFYVSEQQERLAEESVEWAKARRRFEEPILTEISAATPFWPAEEYHQDFYRKNPGRYISYRSGCRRDARLRELWGSAVIGH
jgi:arabinofuranosyltransferase